MVIVSHDREFLDQLCTKIVETEHGLATSYKCANFYAATCSLLGLFCGDPFPALFLLCSNLHNLYESSITTTLHCWNYTCCSEPGLLMPHVACA